MTKHHPPQNPSAPQPDQGVPDIPPVALSATARSRHGDSELHGPPTLDDEFPVESEEVTGKRGEKDKKKKDKKKDKKKGEEGLGSSRGIETMFRTSYQTHNDLSALADNKANIMISINGIIISILIASTVPGVGGSPWLMIGTAVLLLGCLTSMVFAVLAARPRISRHIVSPDEARSGSANILFFGNFVGVRQEDYVEGIQSLMRNTDRIYVNMAKDIYALGGILERKFRLLRLSYTAFMVGLVAGVLLLLVSYVLTGVAIL